ncbi:MAG: prolipoprotein diacylglyceryl transferase [Nostocoides sp.]
MLLSIPSPTVSAWQIGPVTIRAYALCILMGIVVAIWLTGRRLHARGYPSERALDIGAWAVPFGIVGGRVWHLITTPQPYFGTGGDPWKALAIWQGGLGIWGAIALGAVGAYLGCRRLGVPFLVFADAAVPAVALAQAIGRLGNWFNNELYGRPTEAPWGLVIHEMDQGTGQAVRDAAGNPVVLGTFVPTFLLELVFLVLLAMVLLWLDARYSLALGQLTGLYVAGYPLGRIVIENLRSDFANHILGLRVNVWTSMAMFVLGAWLFWHAGASKRVLEPSEDPSGVGTGTPEHPDPETKPTVS